MAGSALARSPSRGQVRLTPCFSRSLTAPLALPPPPPSPAGSARRRRRRRRRQVVAARRRRVTRRSVRDSRRRQRALRVPHPSSQLRGSRPSLSRPSVLAAAAAAAERALSAPLARERALSAAGASTFRRPGLEARLRRGLSVASPPTLPPPTARSAPEDLLLFELLKAEARLRRG